MTTKRKMKNDILLAVIILAVAFVAFFAFFVSLSDGTTVNVVIDGETVASYSLSEDREETFKTEWGENILVIKNGEAVMKYADCPDGICVAHRAISRSGETVVCLPHRLVIEIE